MNKKSNTLCALPWTHLSIDPDGRVLPCCLTSSTGYTIGNVNQDTIESVWNSDKMKQLRSEMIAGEKPSACDFCWRKEDAGVKSDRLEHNELFPEVIDNVSNITSPDGTCTELKLKYWDFRFSNKCNFKCRSCGTRYSSSWEPDKKVTKIDCINNKPNLSFLKSQIEYVEKIFFAGGEPLLSDEHWQILDLLVKHKKFKTKLVYSTNCSTLKRAGKHVKDYWKLWDHNMVTVMPSIDEIGERSELIRSGTRWQRVEDNLVELSKLNNIQMNVGITVGVWNVLRLPVIIDHLIELGVITKESNYTNWYLNMLIEPEHYSVCILPTSYKQKTISVIDNYIDEMKSRLNVELRHMFTQLYNDLKQPANNILIGKFLHNTTILDQSRSEHTFETIPELRKIKVAYMNENIQNI